MPERPIDLTNRVALTITEFSRLTGLSRATIYRLIKLGDLRAMRFGGSRLVIPMTELERIETEASPRDGGLAL